MNNLISSHSYYPLVPPYRKEDHHGTNGAAVKEEAGPGCYPDDPTEVNLDLIHAFDYRYVTLPVRPDLLFLPSDLKAFAKVRLPLSFPSPSLPPSLPSLPLSPSPSTLSLSTSFLHLPPILPLP